MQHFWIVVMYYSGGLNTEHWNTNHTGILNNKDNTFSSCIKRSRLAKSAVFQWSGPLENQIKGSYFVNHWKTKHHWKTEQTPTIQIPSVFGIPAPTVQHILCKKILFGGNERFVHVG